VGTEICSQLVELILVLEMRNIRSIITLYYSVENWSFGKHCYFIL